MFDQLLTRLSPRGLSDAGRRANVTGIFFAAVVGVVAVGAAAIVQAETGAVVLTVLLVPVALAAWFGGVRAWLVFILVAIAVAAFVIVPPAWTVTLTAGDAMRIGFFVLTAVLLLLLVERLRTMEAHTARLVVELERSNEAKTEFVQHVSHELRTPMTIIEGNASTLSARWAALGDDERAASLDDIVDATKRLEAITANLLSLARLGAGYEVEREPVIVDELVNSVLERHRKRHPERVYELVADGHRRPVNCAPVYLVQVVENLLTNAEKYSPAEEEVTVRVERVRDTVAVSVLDRGSGIPAAEAAALFEPFYRGANRGTASGLGIGLAVCKRFAEAEGGTMSARPRDGGGAEFTLTLPVGPAGSDVPPLEGAPRVRPREHAGASRRA